LIRAYGCNHFIRYAHDWEERLYGPNGEPVLAMEVSTYVPKLRPKRTPKPELMLLRFEHHQREELDYLIQHLGVRDLRERGAGPPPPGSDSFSGRLDRLIAEVRTAK